MTERVSVTEVRNALRCPRIFALGRLGERTVAFPVGSSCLGGAFHGIVERFAQAVESPPSYVAALLAGAARDDIEAALARWLLEGLTLELERQPTYGSMPSEIDDLAEALRELARHLAGRLRTFETAPAESLRRAIRSGERSVEGALEAGGAVVYGRLDALYADARGELEVVEYKLTDEANDSLDRAQVALYRRLLREGDGGDAQPVVLRFTPTLRETKSNASDSDALVDRALIPFVRNMALWAANPALAPATERRDLCAACPVAGRCAETYPERLSIRDDPPTAATRPRPGSQGAIEGPTQLFQVGSGADDDEGRREAEHLRDRILTELKKQGIQAICPHPPIVGPTVLVIDVVRPRGPVRQLDSAAEDVRHRLADEAELEYSVSQGRRRFTVTRKKPRRVLLGPLLALKRDWLAAKPGRFVVGQTPDGDILCGDLSDPSTPHLLVAGQSGSGKSVLLQTLVASLLQFHGPAWIRFTLIDPKRVTFNTPTFQSAVAAHLEGPTRYDAESALPLIDQLVDEMEERYRSFTNARVQDLDEYNEVVSPDERRARRVLIVDEFQDLTADRAYATPFLDGVRRLGAKARGAGIHLVLATQRPDRATVPPIIKTNLGGQIALRVASQTNSRIILDQAGAEKLLGRGDLLANFGHGLVRAQAAVSA